jgi:hypothetical protein
MRNPNRTLSWYLDTISGLLALLRAANSLAISTENENARADKEINRFASKQSRATRKLLEALTVEAETEEGFSYHMLEKQEDRHLLSVLLLNRRYPTLAKPLPK